MTPEELRKQADELERQQRETEIEARCGDSLGIEWNNQGRAYEKYGEFIPCGGYAGQPHYDTYSDDYGSCKSCPGCNGSGKNFVVHRHRRPQHDAPRPSA